MKRWQDRGEVLDSDDEEWSQSQERTPKRLRFAERGSDESLLDDGKTVSGKADSTCYVQQTQEPVQDTEEHTALSPLGPARDSGHHEKTPPRIDTKTASAFREGVDGTRERHLDDVAITQQSLQPQSLPDIRVIIGGVHGRPSESSAADSSALSSPLSEREVSPPADNAMFRFPRMGLAPTEDAVSDHNDDGDIPERSLEENIPDEALSAARGYRNLRARKEKQLHPYLFDKAQHQKQFKERGMRPIRYEPVLTEAETQEASLSGDDESAQSFIDETERRNEPSSEEPFSHDVGHERRIASHIQATDREGAGILGRSSLGQTPHMKASYSNKRRRLVHPTRFVQPSPAHPSYQINPATQDGDSVPPSPPATSSGSATHAIYKEAGGKFKMPRGLTPEPLPTPQISSELRDGMRDDEQHELGAASPVSHSRPSTVSRGRVHEVVVPSSSESSAAKSEAEVVDRRLQRERKRIKGVLPASWLKIDFRAQQKQVSPSSRKARRDSSPSVVRTLPQKGVAQRVMSKATASPFRQGPIMISDDDSDQPRSPGSPLLPSMRQSRLNFERDHATAAASELFDEGDIEVDWIDPMLVGTSRPRQGTTRGGRRQPRITERDGCQRNSRQDFSEEPEFWRRAIGATSRSTKVEAWSARPKRRKRRAPPRLSILDNCEHVSSGVPDLPQFLRVATRRARHQSNQGRHSPTHKHIRLATRDDTKDATAVLRSWREGTILPRQFSSRRSKDESIFSAPNYPYEDERREQESVERTPLAEIQHNKRLRAPLSSHKQTNERSRPPRTLKGSRAPKVRQTQLRPIVLPSEDGTEPYDAGHDNRQTPKTHEVRQGQNRLRVQNRPVRYRAAQVETLENSLATEHRAAAFQRRMYHLAEHVARSYRDSGKEIQLQRFFNDDIVTGDRDRRTHINGNALDTNDEEAATSTTSTQVVLPRRPRPRKRQPTRIDAEIREYRQPSEPLPASTDPGESQEEMSTTPGPVLQGLGTFGVRYATDFDILPLPLGTHFHESSFIGSSDFAASLNFANRDLDISSGHIRVHMQNEVLEWGTWTEDVAAGLARIPDAITEILRSLETPDPIDTDEETLPLVLANVDYLLRSTVRYFMWCVSFLDSVDRLQCISSLGRLIWDLLEALAEHESKNSSAHSALSRCLQYILVLSRQHLELCNHALVTSETSARSRDMLLKAAKRLVDHIFPSAYQELRSLYEDNHHVTKRESGIRDADTSFSSIVILRHATQDTKMSLDGFWSVIRHSLAVNCAASSSVSALDKAWYNVFTILPTLEIDSKGLLRPGSRFESSCEDWEIPTSLVKRLFELYQPTSLSHGSRINEYIRATLIRCSYIITRWGCWKCELLLSTVFDFFARRGLKQLHNEELLGSPRFLDDLYREPSFEVQSEDKAFHIFLKMLASALQGMRKYGVYPDKKIGGIAWRFIPNHGRTYRRDKDFLQEDLDALRNHHDLLCVLYYSAPPDRRIRVNVIQNLVDHSVSHREACRLNVRAWQRLASFQASTDEDEQRLDDLCVWFRDMLTITMDQYRLARSEIEHETASFRTLENLEPSKTVVEDTIARNQRQIAATLVDLLAALKYALKTSRNLSIAKYLLNGSVFWQVFDLFQSSERRLHGMLHVALDIVRVVLGLQSTLGANVESQRGSDDSQDYGDSSALEQLVSTRSIDHSITELLHAPLGLFVANVFGADTTTDDSLLTDLVDVWVLLAQSKVQDGHRPWPSYISGYSGDAWAQLRNTEQKRKYTPYFLSRILERGDVDLMESDILTSWLACLVDREAKLKFQHTLTTALLANHPQEQLLDNLPFSRQGQSRCDISLNELRQRRVALISSVLFNMRESWDEARSLQLGTDRQLRHAYATMLKQLMQSMKDKYQELQASRGKDVADAQAEGSYVTFVQQVVSFLQEYTADICPVDRFFTDSPAFPLPSNDPTYVVGRLRSYLPKLNENGKRRELANFIQNVCERAIIDRKQGYLIDQLVSAMVGTISHGNEKASSLLRVLCSAIFPAYIENALSTACSWIVALPILETCERVAAQLLYRVRTEEYESVRMMADTIAILLQSATVPVYAVVTEPGQTSLPSIQRLMRAVFSFARSCLTSAQYLDRILESDSLLTAMVAVFYQYTSCIQASLGDAAQAQVVVDTTNQANIVSQWPDTLQAVRKQVRESLDKNWSSEDGHYYLKKGESSVEVSLSLENNEKLLLLNSVTDFQASYRAIVEGQTRSQPLRDDSCNIDAVII